MPGSQQTLSFLNEVSKPGRYIGGEWNAVRKNRADIQIRLALAFPDVYEIGMSHLGLKILYEVANAIPWVWAERVYAPWPDMEARMRSDGIGLYALESGDPLTGFDAIGFTLQYELSYTNILNMLDLAAIPLEAEERDDRHPIILAGGPCAFNPEPLAPFFDAIVLGEGEEILPEILHLMKQAKEKKGTRRALLEELSGIEGVYVPGFYDVSYHDDGTVRSVAARRSDFPATVVKRIVADVNSAPLPLCPVVPFLDIVQDRIALEVQRGCARGCRFCQAGMVYRPVRERQPENLLVALDESLRSTGYNEITLASLSSSDYSQIGELARESLSRYGASGVTVNLPSLRADSFSIALAEDLESGRKTGLTFAPEAATQRMRDVINKGVNEEDLFAAVRRAAEAGWRKFKLYFMIGLPGETEEDVDAIGRLGHEVLRAVRSFGRGGPEPSVSVSVSIFVPKPHTPFQWRAQDSTGSLQQKHELLKKEVRGRGLSLQWHSIEPSLLEAVFARGDRRLSRVIRRAWEKGCRFDGWSEFFDFARWMEAFQEECLDPGFYANRQRPYNERLPWDHLSAGLDREFLIREDQLASQAAVTDNCIDGHCSRCGVCPALKTRPQKAVVLK